MIKLPIEIGDVILVGRFKNKRVEVKEISEDENGCPTVNGRNILKIRIEKLMKTKKIVKEDTNVNLTLICINDGSVQTTSGEARSADIKRGDIIKVTRENEYFYFGTPQIKGRFIQDPGLSGRRTNNNPVNSNDVEVAINKKNSITNSPDDFWATFKIQSNESKQFKLANIARKILEESEYKSKLDKQYKNDHSDLSIQKKNVISPDNSGPWATTATSISEYEVISLSEKKYQKNDILNWARSIWKANGMLSENVEKVMEFKDMWTVTVKTTVYQN